MFQDLIKKDKKYYNRVNDLLIPMRDYDKYDYLTKTHRPTIGQMHRVDEKIDTEYTFEAVLHFQGFSSGRSAIGADYSTEDHRYDFYTALTFFEEMLQLGTPLNKINGKWSFVKRGAYTSLRLVELL